MTSSLSLEQFFPYRCNRLAERISQAMARGYTLQSGLNIAQWRILATLGEHGAMLARDITVHTNMDKVRVSRAVKSMLQDGLLASRRLDNDHRASVLSLSDAGAALYQELVPGVLEWEKALLSPLSEAEKQQLMRLLARLDRQVVELDKAL